MLWDGQLRKLLLVVRLVSAFLLSVLEQEQDLLRQCLLERWCQRTGQRARKTRAPLYRLRWALSHLWQRAPPACLRRSPRAGSSTLGRTTPRLVAVGPDLASLS